MVCSYYLLAHICFSDGSQLWKLNLLSKKSVTGSFDDPNDNDIHYYYQIENKNGSWLFHDKYWQLPESGNTGFIEEYSSDVLSATFDMFQTIVILQDKDGNEDQQWLISKDGGWFSIRHHGTGQFLTSENEMSLTLEGEKFSIISFNVNGAKIKSLEKY